MNKKQVIREIDKYRYLHIELMEMNKTNLPIASRIVKGELYRKAQEIASHFNLTSISIDDMGYIITCEGNKYEPPKNLYDRLCRECEL